VELRDQRDDVEARLDVALEVAEHPRLAFDLREQCDRIAIVDPA
jgi:hypothetical protein